MQTYHYADTVFIEEEFIYDPLIKNGIFHSMPNAFLIECSISGQLSDVTQVTSTMERGREKSLITISWD